jgi:ribosomal protein S18 acetylase RimI-like enzyme
MFSAMITLEQLSSHLVNHLKTVRLRALHDAPTAFGSTFLKESQLSDEDWLKRVSTWNSDRSVCYIAMDNDAPCGIIAGKFDDNDPQRAEVVSMWVSPAHRRTGLAATLMNAVQWWAQNQGLGELRLMVTNKNAAAIRFYEKCDFAPTGVTGPYPNDPALFEVEMAKPLQGS